MVRIENARRVSDRGTGKKRLGDQSPEKNLAGSNKTIDVSQLSGKLRTSKVAMRMPRFPDTVDNTNRNSLKR